MMKFNNKNVNKMYIGNTLVNRVNDGDFQYMHKHDYSQDYLTFVAEADNMSVGLTNAGNNVYQYSVDSGVTWNNLTNNASTTSVNSGETIIFKASGLAIDTTNGIGILTPSVISSVQGNVMSLVYGDNFSGQTTIANGKQFMGLFYNCANITSAENLILPTTTLVQYCYKNMFEGCTSLTTVPELPATTLASYCYDMMFEGCTSLTTAPELPANTLAYGCYWRMFNGCTSLTTAPELPATTLAVNCYNTMFSGCTSLNYIKCLATDISARACTKNWVNGVASSGTFVKAASMTSWTTGASGIPNGWTIGNT